MSFSDTIRQSIKSRLGIRALEDVTEQSTTSNKSSSTSNKSRSIKSRLGLKTLDSDSRDKPVRSGVIQLDRGSSKSSDIFSRLQKSRESRGRLSENRVLMVPRITIKNRTEDRKLDIKQRLGLLESNDSDSKKKKKKDLDKELIRLLSEEDVDIDFDDLELLSKKEKKKLLKKLLIQQGREEEYEAFTSKKKKKHKSKRDEDGDRQRKINIKGRTGKTEESEQEEEDDLVSEEEIEFIEEEDLESKGTVQLLHTSVKSLLDIGHSFHDNFVP